MASQLVLIETSGNQAYIFSTRKLAQQTGASELTCRAGTTWLREALGLPDQDAVSWREALRTSNGRLCAGVEVVVATSGKAILRVEDRGRAERIIGDITARALREAPGLSVCGAVVEETGRPAEDVRRLHERFNANRQALAMQGGRIPQLPLGEACVHSGLPAARLVRGEPHSGSAARKAACAEAWFTRVREIIRRQDPGIRFAYSIDRLEKRFDEDFVGILFADGNGLGRIILNFDAYLDAHEREGEGFYAALRLFSTELEAATERAFAAACRSVVPPGEEGAILPVVPLILGGDDLTCALGGGVALPFTRAFLAAFEEQTERAPTVARIAKNALGAPRLGISGGLVLVKPHFPYAAAHELAEALLRSAKTVKGFGLPCSSFDVHVVFDASVTDLAGIRARRRGAGGECLWGGPYVTTPLSRLDGLAPEHHAWVEAHHADRLFRAMDTIAARDGEGRPLLPRSQLHALREAVARSRREADELFSLLCRRQPAAKKLEARPGTVFTESPESGGAAFTVFLDALTLSGLCAKTTKKEAA